MNLKVNGFRVGVMAAIMALGAAGCKKDGPYALMPQGLASRKMEQVVDSFYRDGQKYVNSSEYTLTRQDTIKISDFYVQHPEELAKRLNRWCYENNHIVDNNEVEHCLNNYEDSKAVVLSNRIFTNDSINSYIAVAEYDKISK